jgi:hypothetical protein
MSVRPKDPPPFGRLFLFAPGGQDGRTAACSTAFAQI